MNDIQETYLELLKVAIWGRSDERLALSDDRLAEVIRLATFLGTGPLVFDQLLKLKDIEIPDASVCR